MNLAVLKKERPNDSENNLRAQPDNRSLHQNRASNQPPKAHACMKQRGALAQSLAPPKQSIVQVSWQKWMQPNDQNLSHAGRKRNLKMRRLTALDSVLGQESTLF